MYIYIYIYIFTHTHTHIYRYLLCIMGVGSWNHILQLALDAAECFSYRCDIFTLVKVFGCKSQLCDREESVFTFKE